ncbi:PLAC8 family protein [Phytophthora cinnamomi]|uniref:PLAC8 family protein n=1 Tax=Phytophthora cinnamomi TaxID=4785 RepID=UPI00355A78C7|nr:PLAC8 family protein [Phytophthora cinnamomi]
MEADVSSDDLLHFGYLETACRAENNTVLPVSYTAPGTVDGSLQPSAHYNPALCHERDPRRSAYAPTGIPTCRCRRETRPGVLKFLQSRLLPDWAFDAVTYGIPAKKYTTYFDLCPHTPMLFLSPERVFKLTKHAAWPAIKPFKADQQHKYLAFKMAAAAQNDKHYAIKVAADRNDEQFTTGEWDVGLCGCCTDCVPNGFMTACCPCVSMAQISARLGMMEYCCALLVYLVLFSATGGCGTAVWLCLARKETRARYQIPGGCCGDCMASFCCGCCAMAQVATHIKSYKPGSCDFGPQDTLPAYARG